MKKVENLGPMIYMKMLSRINKTLMLDLKSLFILVVFLFSSIALSSARPSWFVPPPLDPSGVNLETVEVHEGVLL